MEPHTLNQAFAQGVSPRASLDANDSHKFF